MLTAPLIDSAMAELEALTPLLSAEVTEAVIPLTSLSPQVRAYKEALLTTRVLLEKLRVVRLFCASRRAGEGPCPLCDGE
jgi:hypothetical protein